MNYRCILPFNELPLYPAFQRTTAVSCHSMNYRCILHSMNYRCILSFNDLPLYPARSFTYCNEQVRADEVQRVIMYKSMEWKQPTSQKGRKSKTTIRILGLWR
jgi:hypothetical protein